MPRPYSTAGREYCRKPNTTSDSSLTPNGKAQQKISLSRRRRCCASKKLPREKRPKRSENAKSFIVDGKRKKRGVDWADHPPPRGAHGGAGFAAHAVGPEQAQLQEVLAQAFYPTVRRARAVGAPQTSAGGSGRHEAGRVLQDRCIVVISVFVRIIKIPIHTRSPLISSGRSGSTSSCHWC